MGGRERPCFHLSIPARDLGRSADWYTAVLGCQAGRRSPCAAIFDLEGHQLVLQHQPAGDEPPQPGIYPRHFGLVFAAIADWQALRQRVEAAGEPFAVAPRCRYAGEPLEHWTFFLQDPSGNWLEFKHYSDADAVLGHQGIAAVGDPELR